MEEKKKVGYVYEILSPENTIGFFKKSFITPEQKEKFKYNVVNFINRKIKEWWNPNSSRKIEIKIFDHLSSCEENYFTYTQLYYILEEIREDFQKQKWKTHIADRQAYIEMDFDFQPEILKELAQDFEKVKILK